MRILLQSFSFSGQNDSYALGILFLQSTLLARKDLADQVEVRILQSDYFDRIDDVYDEIERFDPDLLGLGVFIWSYDLSEKLLGRFEGQWPIVVCGGTGLISRERDFLTANDAVDVVVRGPGEATFVELVEHYLEHPKAHRDLSQIEGITYRDGNGAVCGNADRTRHTPLSEIPSPYLEGHYTPPGDAFFLETERYCPYRCSYCTWTHGAKSSPDLRFPIELVRDEVLWSAENGHTNVSFFDSAINHDYDRFVAILRAIHDSEPKASVDHFFFLKYEIIDERQLRALAATRKQLLVFLGFETFSPAALRVARRPNRMKRLVPLLDAFAKIENVRLMIALILGLPGDDLNTFFRGVEMLMRYPQVQVIISTLSVAPGTWIRDNAAKLGLQFPRTGVPLIEGSNDFPGETLEAAYDRIESLIPTGQISLNPTHVPLSRLENPEILPADVRKHLSADAWVRVGVRGIGNGMVAGSGYYPDIGNEGETP